MNNSKLQAWWFHRQGLDGSLAGTTANDVLAQAGWSRSVAGSGPYLTLFARAGLSREAVDEAVESLQIHELPSARGCTYVLPHNDFALGLRVAEAFSGNELRVARKLGVTDQEIDKLGSAAVAALRKDPLGPDEIRATVGAAARNLGEEGVRKGLTTTLPVALGALQVAGKIRRIPMNGRLDQQRYRYTLWEPNPLRTFNLSTEEANVELARRYFRWIGPATMTEFQWFSGLGVKAAKLAVAPLGLVALESGGDRWMFPEDLKAYEKFETPSRPKYAMVSSLDSIFLLRRSLAELLNSEAAKKQVYSEKGMRELGTLSDLSSNAILDRGSIVGLWEYDPDNASVVWQSFTKPDKALAECIAVTQNYVRDQLGDARSFSLDSPKSRAPRINALRQGRPK